MKNLKLTLVATLSILALTFAGTASADRGVKDNQHNVTSKATFTHNANRNVGQSTVRNERINPKEAKRVLVNRSSTNNVRNNRSSARFNNRSNQRFNQGQRYNQRAQYNSRRYNNRSNYNNRRNYNNRSNYNRYTNIQGRFNIDGVSIGFNF